MRSISAQNFFCFNSFLILFLLIFSSCSGTKTDKANPDPSLSSLSHFYKDADGDGFGDPNQVQEGMSAPEGFVSNNSDCNDQNNKVNPRSEISENTDSMLDFNCDGIYSWLPQKFYLNRSVAGATPIYCEGKFDALERKKIRLCHRNESPSSELFISTEYFFDETGKSLGYKIHAGDLLGRVTSSAEYTFDESGNILIQKEHLNGDFSSPVTSSIEITYRSRGKRLLYQQHERGDLSSPVTFSIEYFYNDQGNEIRNKMTSNEGSIVISFPVEKTYDAQGNELTFKEYRNGPSPIPPTFSREISYDASGNKLSEKIHNGGDLSSPVTSSVEFVYDHKGNVLLYKEHQHGDLNSPVTLSREYSYDEKGNRLSYKEHRGGDISSPVTDSWEARSEDYIPVRTPLHNGEIY